MDHMAPLAIGASWTKTYRIESEQEIIAFAKNLNTNNRGHLEHKAAVWMGYRTIFAPGGMIYSFVEETVTERAPSVTLREISLKYRNPLYAPSTPIITCTVTDKDRNGTTILVKIRDGSGMLAFGTCRVLER